MRTDHVPEYAVDFRQFVDALEARPSMLLPDNRYNTMVGFVQGLDSRERAA